MAKKVIKFMDTSFRDGFQSVFGARVLTDDFIPALEATVEAGVTYLEAGGGARFQSLFFYCNESAFDMMDRFRATAGPEAELQTLARGISVVALNQQPKDIIDLHAKMFKKHGMSVIRNFDALNDINNLKYSGERIAAHGLKHQVVITIMDLPPNCEGAHTPDFYLMKLEEILKSDIPFHSICFKDSTGTANPQKIYKIFSGARKMCSQDTVLWFHTHDTLGFGISQNLAAIEGGADGIDLAKSPVSGGTSQPDILTMIQSLKGSDYTLDVDAEKMLTASEVFEDSMKDYFYPPESRMISPKIVFSPMPGGALTANTMMMRDTQTLHLYPKVISEMTEAVRLGGFGSSVTPVSQFYFQQAYLNAVAGKWVKINPQYGDMVLGYYGRTPVEPDPKVVKLASEQLKKPIFKGDPLDLLEPGIPEAKKILTSNNLPVTDENLFIVASCGEKGLDYLTGKGEILVRKKEKPEESKAIHVTASRNDTPEGQSVYSFSVNNESYNMFLENGNISRTISSLTSHRPFSGFNMARPSQTAPRASAAPTQGSDSTSNHAAASDGDTVNAQIPGKIVKILVEVGDEVEKSQTLLICEAMKMETEVKSHKKGTVKHIHVKPNDVAQAGVPLVSVE